MAMMDANGAVLLAILLGGALAAAAIGPALVRVLPFERGILLGSMGALASGVMLGAAYLIMATSMQSWPGITPLAAVLTVMVIYVAHRKIGALPGKDTVSRRMALLHGIPEGLALGTVLATRLPLGIWLGVTVVLHNVAEGAIFDARGQATGSSAPSLGRAMYLAFVDKLPQVVAALASWVLVTQVPVSSAPLFASAFAGLVYLVIAELLMEAYERIGRVGVALTVMAAGAVVATLGGG